MDTKIKKRTYVPWIGIILAISIFVVEFLLIPGSGMTWDEPSSFFFGRANLKFWQTGNRKYVTNFKDPALFTDSPFQYIYGEDIYPPFPFVVSSLSSYVLAEKTHVLPTIDAHHVGELFLGVVGIGFFYYLLIEIGLSIPVAVVTTLIYALYPTIFGQMRSDAKDVPLMSMLVVTAYWYIRWLHSLKKGSKERVLSVAGFGVSFGLALGSKPTAIILLPVFASWFVISSLLQKKKEKIAWINAYVFDSVVMLSVSAFVAYLSWPWLWDDPAQKIRSMWEFFRTVGYGLGVLFLGHWYQAGINLPKIYPYAILLFQTPPETMVLFAVGVVGTVVSFWKRSKTIYLFFLLWFAIAMARFLLPGVIVYARVRHFIDAMPAFFVLVGIGLEWLKTKGTKIGKVALLLACVIVVHEGYIIYTHYPFEPGYYNIYVGGTKTIAQKKLFDADYWGSGVKQSMDFIKTHHTGPASVYTCQLLHLARFYDSPGVEAVADGSIANYVIVPNSPSYFGGPILFHKTYDELVYTVIRADAPLFYVFKRKVPGFWNCGPETASNYQ